MNNPSKLFKKVHIFLIHILSIVYCCHPIFSTHLNDEKAELLVSINSLTREDAFSISQAIANKKNGKNLILKNILRDHTGKNVNKSYFYAKSEIAISELINEAISAPTFHDISKSSGKLMIVKDFVKPIGVHITPTGSQIVSNRLTLFFGGAEKVFEKGQPWDTSIGVLLTGFPDNPSRKY